MKRVLVTGASGFVGSRLLAYLGAAGHQPIAALRGSSDCSSLVTPYVRVGDLLPDTDWTRALENVDVVVHAAARVHIMNDKVEDPLQEFRQVNVHGTLNCARQAAEAGVKRFIFISSIKVNGEETELGNPYTEDHVPAPVDPYGISKMEAEAGLLALATDSKMDITIIRPVLVYGPDVKANFRSMMNWLNKSVPLPLGAIYNKRSMVALDNLVDLIVTCIDHRAAANQVFLVSDGEDLSTTELLQRTASALGKPGFFLPVPSSLLSTVASLIGKAEIAQRLCGSLQVDISKTKRLLNWAPPISVDEALRKTARHFLEQRKE
jgi:nucleoside-diphosphate-sugar epimerase